MTLFFLGIALILAGGLAAALLRRRPALADRAFGVLVAGGCALGLVPAVAVLSGRDVVGISFAMPMPGGPWAFAIWSDIATTAIMRNFSAISVCSAALGSWNAGPRCTGDPVAFMTFWC